MSSPLPNKGSYFPPKKGTGKRFTFYSLLIQHIWFQFPLAASSSLGCLGVQHSVRSGVLSTPQKPSHLAGEARSQGSDGESASDSRPHREAGEALEDMGHIQAECQWLQDWL